MKTTRKIPYGMSNYERILKHDYVFVDKTMYIEKLENLNESFLFFLRPRRFGKSLFISMLQYYYGMEHKEQFQSLFGTTYIGKNPTPNANGYAVLLFDFSRIATDNEEKTFNGFNLCVQSGIRDFASNYKYFTPAESKNIIDNPEPAGKMIALFNLLNEKNIAEKIYILIDEYDHFANEIIAFNFDHFAEIVSGNGYVRKFYEAIKTGPRDGIVERMFVTGVTPVTLDSITSGFNIGSNVTLEKDLNEMMGFTEEELRYVIRETCEAGKYDEGRLVEYMEALYNGSLFSEEGAHRLYNSDMVLYFLSKYSQLGYKHPKLLVDMNIASDYGKIKKFLRLKNPEQNAQILQQLISENELTSGLTQQFIFERDYTDEDFVSLLFYNGLLTVKEAADNMLVLCIPNYVIKELYWAFFVDMINEETEIPFDVIGLKMAIRKLSRENDIKPWIALIENILKHLSNRDMMRFDEKYVILIFFTYASIAGLYNIKSEAEFEKKYTDLMFLFRKPFRPKYQFLFELKYIKKENAGDLEKVTEQAIAQVKGYLQKDEIKHMEDLKCWVIVFVGDEAKTVLEIMDESNYELRIKN